ncbi:MAG: hypothetical protein ACRDY0_02185 [Acidimicrobiales bacterium]
MKAPPRHRTDGVGRALGRVVRVLAVVVASGLAVPLAGLVSPASASAAVVYASDSFNRTVSGSWGTADTGGPWSASGPAYAVSPGSATIAADQSAPSNFLTSVSAQDVDAEVKISPPPISNGYVDVGMGVRYGQAGGTFYQVSAFYASGSNAGNYTAELKAEPADTAISPDVSTTIAGGTAIWFRLQAQGVNPTVLRWKIWQDGSPEPAGWTSTATDSTPAMQVAGGVGLKAYSGSLTQPVAFNGVVVNPVAVPPPTIESCPSGVVICDTFNRSVAGGWGSADSGGPWSTSGSIWSVQPGTGSLVASPAAPTNFLAGPVQDVDAEVKITPPGISGSYVDTGLAVRYNASSASAYQLSAYYATGNNNGDYTVELKTEPSNTAIEADVNTAVAGGTPFWLRLQATGTSPTTLSWKIWADGTTEPTAWTATATDGTPGLQAAGGVGVKGYAGNTTPIGFDVLWATDSTPPPPPPPPPSQFTCVSSPLACDTFARTATNGWGRADVGGSWTISGNASNWSVTPGTGSVQVVPGGAEIGTLGKISIPNVEVLTELTLPLVTNGSSDAYVLGRYVGGSAPTYYRVGVVRSRSLASLVIRAQRGDGSFVLADVSTALPESETVPVMLRVQFQGTNPTALRARVWEQGSPEPSTWNMATTDSTAAMQGQGALGLRVRDEDPANAMAFQFEGLQAVALAAGPGAGTGTDVDAFGRTASGTWGTADAGGPWSTAGAAYQVVPGRATVVANSSTPTNFLATSTIQDVDLECWISPTGMTTAYYDAGIAVRYGPSGGTFYQLSAYYASGNNGGNYTVQLKRKPSNTLINPDFQTTIPGGTGLWLRLEAQGVNPTVLRWKAWQDGTAEPTAWTGTATDSTAAMQGSGGVGVEAYANSGTAVMAFNRLTAKGL